MTQNPPTSESSKLTVIPSPILLENDASPSKGASYHQCPDAIHSVNRECSMGQRTQGVAEIRNPSACAPVSGVCPSRVGKLGESIVNNFEYRMGKNSNSRNRAFSPSSEYNPFQETEIIANSMRPEPSTNPFDDDDDYSTEGVHRAEKPLSVYERTDHRHRSDQIGNASQKMSVEDSSYHSAEEVSNSTEIRRDHNSADGCQTLPGNPCCQNINDRTSPTSGIHTLPVFPFTYPTNSEFSMMSKSTEKQPSTNVIRRFSSFINTKKK